MFFLNLRIACGRLCEVACDATNDSADARRYHRKGRVRGSGSKSRSDGSSLHDWECLYWSASQELLVIFEQDLVQFEDIVACIDDEVLHDDIFFSGGREGIAGPFEEVIGFFQ